MALSLRHKFDKNYFSNFNLFKENMSHDSLIDENLNFASYIMTMFFWVLTSYGLHNLWQI